MLSYWANVGFLGARELPSSLSIMRILPSITSAGRREDNEFISGQRTTNKGCSALTVSLLTALCPRAFALNPSLDISQYAHKAWTIRDGFLKGMITSIAQTEDGYLWLGTEFGLLRFDGFRALEWTPSGSERLPKGRISGLFTARDGTLWIGTEAELASWNGVKLTRYAEFEGRQVRAILEDREETIWIGTFELPHGRLCGMRGGKLSCYGEDGSLGRGVQTLYQDGMGDLWAGTDSGLWLWKPGPPKRISGNIP